MRRARRRQGGVTMVEFALVAPFLFIILLGLIVCGIVATNYVQLTNAVRDGARAAAICGGSSRASGTVMPDGSTCGSYNLSQYIQHRLQAVPAPVSFSVSVLLNDGTVQGSCTNCTSASTVLDLCTKGETIEVSATFPQPLYLPLVGNLLSNTSGNARNITADAEATCEQ